LLTPQGRFLNDMFVVADGETLLLETERERATALARKLSIYKLRSQVKVEDRSATMEVAAVFGAGIDAARLSQGGLVAFVDPRLSELGARVLGPAGKVAAALSSLGCSERSLPDYDALRLSFGVPDGSRDLVVEKALLLENGFDELNGVDWQKGCYMGQELTARTKYRALIRKRLFPVKVEGTLPEPGAPVLLAGEEVGELRSGSGDRALALLKVEAARAGTALTAGNARVTPEIPGWMRLPESTAP